MRGKSTWDYKPYTRLNENWKKTAPYLCRLAPGAFSCALEWFDHGAYEGDYFLHCRQRGSDRSPIRMESVLPGTARIDGLIPQTEYEVYIARSNGSARSSIRRFRTGDVPGVVVNYLHPHDNFYGFSGKYLCSPCLLKTPSGALLASMDVYGVRMGQNLTFLYRSEDGGNSWRYVTDLFPCFWGKLFLHEGKVHMLAVSGEYGNLMIGRSEDEGFTWNTPVRLFPGCGIRDEQGMHQTPTPVICHQGRIWTAVDYGTWELDGHASALVSIDVTADLLVPENWCCTEFLPFDRSWPGAVPHAKWGCHEGNAVPGPDGEVYNMLRYQISEVFTTDDYRGQITHGKAMLLKADRSDPEKQLAFYKFVDFNGGMSKFVVRLDEVSGHYISLVNRVIDETTPGQRNILSLAVSPDLEHWRIVEDLIDASACCTEDVGFQYADFIIDGEDLLYLSRTAFNNADNFHDSNYITFHRKEGFRECFAK